MVGRRIDGSPERSRAVHSQSRRQAIAKTTNIRAFLQTVSCSDDDRRSTHNPAQGAERARIPDGLQKRRDVVGIAWSAGADAGIHRGDEGPQPDEVHHAAYISGDPERV